MGWLFLHLLFAKDTLSFCEGILYTPCSLQLLFLKINLENSRSVPIGSIENVYSLATILGCRFLHPPVGVALKARCL